MCRFMLLRQVSYFYINFVIFCFTNINKKQERRKNCLFKINYTLIILYNVMYCFYISDFFNIYKENRKLLNVINVIVKRIKIVLSIR